MKKFSHAGNRSLVWMLVLAGLTSVRPAVAQDVALDFAVGMGGTGGELGIAIAVDALGNVYTTGFFEGTADFDPGGDTANLTSAGNTDIFVSKLDSSGNFVWASAIGGSGLDAGSGIAVDALGNVYTTGFFQGTADLMSQGSFDIFVTKLDSAGNSVWIKAMGGFSFDVGAGIAVDASGNVYTTGLFESTADFDPGTGTADLTSTGSFDIFVSKLDSAGNFVWARAMGELDFDAGLAIAVDASGNVYTSGVFQGTVDFDPGPGTADHTSTGSADIFVTKLDSAGNFVWAKSMGGLDFDSGNGIAVDASGNVYTTGSFQGTVDFDPGADTADLTSAGDEDAFVTKLDSAGDFLWVRGIGGVSADAGSGIAVDGSGNVYTAGNFTDMADFDLGADTAVLSTAGGTDIFLSKLDSAGDFVWAKAMGGTGGDFGNGIAVDALGNVYTTGVFSDTADFDPGADTAILSVAGETDIFVTKHAVVPSGSGDCFIATAAYGTPMAEEVGVLRGVRDDYLLMNVFGTAFTDTYYRVSPPIADIVRESPGLRAVVRGVLAPILFLCRLLLVAPVSTSLLGAFLVAVFLRGMSKGSRFARVKRP